MLQDGYTTLIVNSLGRADNLRKILANHGVDVRFEAVPHEYSGEDTLISVSVPSRQLPLAVKIIESGEDLNVAQVTRRMAGMSGNLLIPVDFSPYSMLACKVGFELARRLSLHPVVLHTYAAPYFSQSLPYAPGFDDVDGGAALADAEAGVSMRREAQKSMSRFCTRLHEQQERGELIQVKFSEILNEGVPEEVIIEYARATPPALIVMATRGIHKKEEELVGSVTAEVLDNCRVPVFTVPEDYRFPGVKAIRRLAFFCSLDRQDIMSVDALMRMFGYPDVEVTLVPAAERISESGRENMKMLRDYLRRNYPTAVFDMATIDKKDFKVDLERLINERGVELLIVPNRKTNAFRRLFKPGIAHRILFERDIPMLVLPV